MKFLHRANYECSLLVFLIKSIYSTDEECGKTPDLCLVALKYLQQFASMLRSMYQMPACPLFSSARRLQSCDDPKLIDTSRVSSDIELTIEITLRSLDRPVKILHVWYLLIDDLSSAIESCPKRHQIEAMEMLFEMLSSLREIPGLLGISFNMI